MYRVGEVRMGRFVTVAKAAQLIGITRRELQVEIDKGELSTVRGMIHIDDLADVHPNVKVEEADMVAWVTKIKNESLQHATEKLDHDLSKSELHQLLIKANTELAYHRDKNTLYESLIHEIRHSLTVLQRRSTEPNKIQSIIDWIDHYLAH